jgi:hypothetical protein
MIIDDTHAARAFLLDRPLAAPVRVLWNGPPSSGNVVSPEAQTEEWTMKDCGVIFGEYGYTNRGATMRRATSFPLLDLL